jgi:hypothetical protein
MVAVPPQVSLQEQPSWSVHEPTPKYVEQESELPEQLFDELFQEQPS